MTTGAVDRFAELLLQRFPGRTDCYLIERQGGAARVKAPLNLDVLRAHVLGKGRIGVYPGDRPSYGMIDFDGKYKDHEGRERAWRNASHVAQILDADLNITPIIELSRSGMGWHVWVLTNPADPPNVDLLRQLLKSTLRAAGLPDGGDETKGHAGIFPHPAGPKGFGRTGYLPWGGLLNGAKGGRFIGLDQTPLDRQETALEDADLLTRDRIERAVGILAAAERESGASTPNAPELDEKPKPGAAEPLPEEIPKGGRNAALASLAGSMRRRGATAAGIEAALLVENTTRCRPPLDREEVVRIARSVGAYPSGSEDCTEGGDGERFAVWHAADSLDFLTGEPEPIPWLIEPLIARDDSAILTAPPKSGKSWVALQLAVDVALGRRVLDCYDGPEASRVLIVDEENGARRLRRRLRQLVAGLGLKPDELGLLANNLRIYTQQGISLAESPHRLTFLREVEQWRPALTLLDSYSALSATEGGSEGNNVERRMLYRLALAPLRELGTAALLIAHPPLPSRDAAPGSQRRPRGAGDVLGSCDRALWIERVGEEKTEHGRRLITTLGETMARDGEGLDGPQTVIVEDVGPGAVRVHAFGGEAGVTSGILGKIVTAETELLHMLRRAPERELYQPQAKTALEELGFTRDTIQQAISKAERERHVRLVAAKRDGSGRKGKWIALHEDADDVD